MRDSSHGRLALAVRRPPLWARWVLALAGAAILIAVIAIVTSGGEGSSNPTASERGAEVEANREGRIVVEQDQAPHSAPLGAGVPASVALRAAIARDANRRILHSELTGPLQRVRCGREGPSHGGLRAVRCTAYANGISYPFVAVVDARARRLTWCKVDPPP